MIRELNKQLMACGIGIDSDSIDSTSFLGVFHCHEWNHGYDDWNGLEVYPDGTISQNASFRGLPRAFYDDCRDITSFILDYFAFCNINEVVVAPCYKYNQFEKSYFEKNFLGYDIFNELRGFLKSHGVRKGDRTGVKLPIRGNEDTIAMVLEGSFRGVSQLCLFSLERKVLIEPNHHFNLVLWTNSFEKEKEVVTFLLQNHSKLRYYDMCNGVK